jgi:hypothetical protein
MNKGYSNDERSWTLKKRKNKIKSGAKSAPKAFLAPPREEMIVCVEL